MRSDVWGGCCVSSSPSPLPLLRLSLGLSPLRLPRRPCPLAPQGWACCERAGVWPLCGPPPGVSRVIRATMARDCSSGVPLPPNGGGAPLPSSISTASPAPLPSASSCVKGGGPQQVLGFPPISWFRARMNGVRGCLGGGPPSPSGWGPSAFSSPPPCTPFAWGARCSGGPFWVLVVRELGSPCLCMLCASYARCSGDGDAPTPSSSLWLWGSPPSSSGMPCAESAHCLAGGSPPSTGLGPSATYDRGPSPGPPAAC